MSVAVDYVNRDRIRQRYQIILRNALICRKQIERCENLVSCSFSDLIKHFESMFTPRMTWENHGRYGWHIDHVKACYNFNFDKIDGVRECFHYKNLQPLWHDVHAEKSALEFKSSKKPVIEAWRAGVL